MANKSIITAQSRQNKAKKQNIPIATTITKHLTEENTRIVYKHKNT